MINPNIDFLTNTVACWEVRICKLPLENSWPISVGATVPFYAPGSAGRTGNGGGWGQVSCNFRTEDGPSPKAQPGSLRREEWSTWFGDG